MYYNIILLCTIVTIQKNQPTICNNFSSLLLEVYLQLNMFRASSRLSSGAVNKRLVINWRNFCI